MTRCPLRPTSRAFTLIELLVVIAIIAVLLSILLPGLAAARMAAKSSVCASRLHQLGIAMGMYLGDFDRTLPQLKADVGGGYMAVVGALFGGKKGTLPAYGINQFGPERRPLNRYVSNASVPTDDSGDPFEMEAFHSPADVGGNIPGIGRVNSMYDLLGSSYTLNDHTLTGESSATLVPGQGGKMPMVVDTTKTWLLGTHTMYNYQENGDRGIHWYSRSDVAANLLFVDLHVGGLFTVPKGIVNTTKDYTFLPSPTP